MEGDGRGAARATAGRLEDAYGIRVLTRPTVYVHPSRAVGLEPRFRTAIMVSGGIASAKKLPEVDLFHFAPRVNVPVLMLNGDSDFVYSLEHGQKPLFKLLGSPPEHKRHVVYPGGHGLGHVRHQLIKETLDWLDKYVGPV